MKKQMQEVSVYTLDSVVIIEQPVPFNDDAVIYLSPEQVDIVILWLKEAKEELNGS